MPFKNMQEMYDLDYKFFVEPGSSHWDAFKYGNDLRKKIYKEKLEPFEGEYKSILGDRNRIIDWLLNDNSAAVYGSLGFYSHTQQFADCKLVASPGKYGIIPTAIAYQKDSPYAEMFDYHIEQMRAAGVLDRITAKYNEPAQKCPGLRSVVLVAHKTYWF